MANKNPLAGRYIARLETPHAEPHAPARKTAHQMHHPKHHPDKVTHKGRPMVEMPRGHGARASSAGRDVGAKQPGLKEPSGIQRGRPGSVTKPSVAPLVRPVR